MLTVFVPPNEPTTVINGNTTYNARMHHGRLVIDLPPVFFRKSILLGKRGREWERENPEAMSWMGSNDDFMMVNNAFPGDGRPPPVVPVWIEAKPVMVRLIAPEGVTNYSHGGTPYNVDTDGSVTVDDKAAAALRSHGFRDAS